MNTDLKEYYARRAPEYEQIYAKPERQEELAEVRRSLQEAVRGRTLLELACGTGFWTQPASAVAERIVASDINREVLDIARSKSAYGCPVAWLQSDTFAPAIRAGQFTGGVAMFWWSHMPRSRWREWVRAFTAPLRRGAAALIADNSYVEGNSTRVSRQDEEGNTFQLRTLSDGTRHEVLKNFPSDDELRDALAGHAEQFQIVRLKYYWVARFRVL